MLSNFLFSYLHGVYSKNAQFTSQKYGFLPKIICSNHKRFDSMEINFVVKLLRL